jgi:hypothetical protein
LVKFIKKEGNFEKKMEEFENPMQGYPFPSYVVEVFMLQMTLTHIPNSRRCNLGCLPSESGVTIIKVRSPKLPIVNF